MTVDPKLFQLLGLAMRAGKIISGEDRVITGIRKGHVCLVLLAEDASANTMKKLTDKCTYYRVPYHISSSRYTLGHAIGKKEGRVVVGVTDEGFAAKMQQYTEESEHLRG